MAISRARIKNLGGRPPPSLPRAPDTSASSTATHTSSLPPSFTRVAAGDQHPLVQLVTAAAADIVEAVVAAAKHAMHLVS
ncbi:Os07g0552900 [Oryza sativa Japonica Group]|uniref:Os07g0552900 protein n=1 Tax=Oryza sativa subsp. japonica TaxID=39947 RepID=A0A0N7KNM9_ORYSJ|nr:Os07g0552900 [Oryza sativa Japonica Group]